MKLPLFRLSKPFSSARSIPVTARRLMAALLLTAAASQFQGCPGPKPMNDVPAPTPTPTPMPATPTPTPAPTPEPTPTPETMRYSGTQQKEYIDQAQNAFITARGAVTEPFALAKAAFNEAGGATAKGLTSKEAVAARRETIAKIMATNEDYLKFVQTQNDAYKQELAKTPLIQSDIDSLVAEFVKSSKSESVLKLRELDRDLYKIGDEMMAYLDKSFGSWTIKDNKAAFKKPADSNAYAALAKKFNTIVEAEKPLQMDMNPPLPTPGASPLASVSPGTNPAAPAATVAAPTTNPAATR